MPLRILFLLFAFVLFTNLVIMLLSLVFKKNLYQTHGKLIANCYGIFTLIIVIVYTALAFAGIE